jgi:hypothetical protein
MHTNDNHTPGPWKYQNGHDGRHPRRIITNGGPAMIAIMADTEASGSLAPLFNAKLIAAAPELLAALRGLLVHFEGPQCLAADYPGSFYMAELERAKDAIAKATGGRDQ